MKKLFFNAVFHLMDEGNSSATAVLTEKGMITGVLQPPLPTLPDYEPVDLRGCHVFPGFIDTHTHSFEGGLYSQSLNLSGVKSIDEVLERIRDFCTKTAQTDSTVIDAFRFDENSIKENRFPTVEELDFACPDLPLVLRRIDGHSSIINTAAWNKFADANGSHIKANNLSPGVFRGESNDIVVHWFLDNMSETDILQAYHNASKIALANGITTVHTMIGDSAENYTHYAFLQNNLHILDCEYVLYPQGFDIRGALELGARRIGGCILADGSLGSHTAALRKPYSDKPDTHGLLYRDNAFWEKFISEASEHNLQVGVHCIGDAAIKQINDAYLNVFRKKQHDLRHELIHCELTPDDLVEEIVISQAIPVMQPAFDLYWGGKDRYYEEVVGPERLQNLNRFGTFLSKGVPITGGSDWYITELDALQGIRAAVYHNNQNEAIKPFDAIIMYTVNAAFLSHDENRLGKLLKGYDADFVCLDGNILTFDGLTSSKIQATYKKGRLVYSR